MDHAYPDYKYSALTDSIICCFYTVYNTLGYGFLEKVYLNALMLEFNRRDIAAIPQAEIEVYYLDSLVGKYFADILVEEKVIIEVKAARTFTVDHEAQLLSYLKATNIEVGLLLNFGPKPEVRRKAFENTRKVYQP